MKIAIFNCDFDEDLDTNGAELARSCLFNIGLNRNEIVIKNVFENQVLIKTELKTYDGIIITGSRASVYEKREWISKLLDTIRAIDKLNIPTLGICFGFQAVAQALGGNVVFSGKYEEGFKTVRLTKSGKENVIFNKFPEKFKVFQSHWDVVDTLPKNSTTLAKNNMLEAYTIRNFFCVQFHPEVLPDAAIKMAIRDRKNRQFILNSIDIKYNLTLNILSNFLGYCKESRKS